MRIASPSPIRWLAVLLCAVIITRTPLLLTGYSYDSDAWRVASVGVKIWKTGTYEVSRFPGYPLHEMLAGPFVLLGGSFLSNLATLLAALVAVVIWYRLVRKEARFPKTLTVLLAFTPLFWIDSSGTLDYVWSLLFILFSLSAILVNKTALAGILFGCAVGFRPTNFIIVAPLLVLQHLLNTPRKRILAFMLYTTGTSLLAFTPVFVTYGFSGWIQRTLAETRDIHHPIKERSLFFVYRLIYSIGPLACAAIGSLLVIHRKAYGALLQARDPLIAASTVGVAVSILLFAVFPLERSYLLPAFPFLYLLIDKVASARALTIVSCCVISFAFINPDVVLHKGRIGTPGVNIHPGTVVENWQRRVAVIEERRRIATVRVDSPAVVMTGADEIFWFENELVVQDTLPRWTRINTEFVHAKDNPGVHFIMGLPKEAARALQSEGFVIYCLDSVVEFLPRKYGYTVSDIGVRVID